MVSEREARWRTEKAIDNFRQSLSSEMISTDGFLRAKQDLRLAKANVLLDTSSPRVTAKGDQLFGPAPRPKRTSSSPYRTRAASPHRQQPQPQSPEEQLAEIRNGLQLLHQPHEAVYEYPTRLPPPPTPPPPTPPPAQHAPNTGSSEHTQGPPDGSIVKNLDARQPPEPPQPRPFYAIRSPTHYRTHDSTMTQDDLVHEVLDRAGQPWQEEVAALDRALESAAAHFEPAEPVDQRGEARRALDASLDELRRTVSRAPVNGSANGHSSRGGTNGAHRGSSPFGAATVAAADNPFL